MATFKSKTEIIERLKSQIEVKDSTAIHTLLFVYDNQIEDEKASKSVRHHNGVGFKPQDAVIGSNFATWYKEKGFFTERQMRSVKRLVKKYAGQIVECKISEGEIVQLRRGNWVWHA